MKQLVQTIHIEASDFDAVVRPERDIIYDFRELLFQHYLLEQASSPAIRALTMISQRFGKEEIAERIGSYWASLVFEAVEKFERYGLLWDPFVDSAKKSDLPKDWTPFSGKKTGAAR